MSKWNVELYLKFEKQRTQPAIDLAKRLEKYQPFKIVDLGCGPGNSTAVLKSVFKDAKIVGIDSSFNMIEKAKVMHPDIHFKIGDVRNLEETYDLIFSNACLQWVSNHKTLLPYLMKQLNVGGILAVQIPINSKEPLFEIIKDTVDHSSFDFSKALFEKNEVLSPEEYYEILSTCSSNFEIWESVYYHEMASHDDLIQWVRSTRLRPYLDCLKEEEKKIFESDILEKVKKEYSIMSNGHIILKFRRLFFIAER